MTTDERRAQFEALLDRYAVAVSALRVFGVERAAVIAAFDAARGTAEHTAEPSAQGERERFRELVDELIAMAHAPLTAGMEAREAVFAAFDRALAASPAPEPPWTTDEAQPVGYLWIYASTGNFAAFDFSAPREEIHSRYVVIPVYRTPRTMAAQSASPDARSTSDAAVDERQQFDTLLYELVSAVKEPAVAGRTTDAYIALLDAFDSLADRATRSTDSSAEAAGMERAAQVCERMGEQFGASDTDASHHSVTRRAITATCLDLATAIRAEAAKLSTAPHTAAETRVDGGAT